jgi:Uma2 family endonuclease
MQIVLPEESLSAKLTLDPDTLMNDDEYFAFCMANANLRIERTARGEIVIVPPAGFESDHQNVDVVAQLDRWARRDGRGLTSGSSVEFILPTRAAMSPDASWVSKARLATLPKDQLTKFPRIAPEFVVEVMSPSDRLKAAKAKMDNWMAGGVELAWLIHAKKRTVYIYRAGQPPEERKGVARLAGEGPVAGFELDLTDIWAGVG